MAAANRSIDVFRQIFVYVPSFTLWNNSNLWGVYTRWHMAQQEVHRNAEDSDAMTTGRKTWEHTFTCRWEHNLVWIFDHSSGHNSFGPDALIANRMNVHPGGKQPKMHDTVMTNGEPQSMVDSNGVPKGLKTGIGGMWCGHNTHGEGGHGESLIRVPGF